MTASTSHLKRWARTTESVLQRTLTAIGLSQSTARIAADSQAYWTSSHGKRWMANSHWREAPIFDDNDLWIRMGMQHLGMVERSAWAARSGRPWRRVVDWGCGGGANAAAFAPHTGELVGVDISAETVAECGRQVALVCDTPFRGVTVDVAEPETAMVDIGSCDVFLCLYVFELIPTPEYGVRLLHIARDLLTPGGLALIQIKYDDGRWLSRPRRREYRRELAGMTTYRIPAFWQLVERCGLTPVSIELVPRNELDERYAYFVIRKR
ncbi:Methyltransferase domain-containing protein [Amycolatopsis marina]|uniref:Methyltransferase domain-containing protein n=1 Tax=Amycolatopsis marina TaxID=490629 RepID=A0A1I1C253_9PSEU|nr:class I SAM-dependent methyltransferase [Amycolatopsis marina]SFB56754.1 Methyltransferase domain-containing protein [Amycolatopsis marina]